MSDINRCGTCKFYTGINDFDLCCEKSHTKSTAFGFLCYPSTPACGQYEAKSKNTYDYFNETMNV